MTAPRGELPWKRIALTAAVAMLLLWGLSWWLVMRVLGSWSDRAAFGEMFGAINALFSGLALAGVVLAILMQKHELELQRDELRRAAEAQDVSSQAMKQQVQLMIAAAKLSAHATLLEFYGRGGDTKIPGFLRDSKEAGHIERLLGEINLMSTQEDPPKREK